MSEVEAILSLIKLGKPNGQVGTLGCLLLAGGLIFLYANIVRIRKELDRIEEKKNSLKELSKLPQENKAAEESQKKAEAEIESE